MTKPPLRRITKQLLSGVVGVVTALVTPPLYELTVQALHFLEKYPRVAVFSGGALTILALLHDPRVMDGLGIKRKVTTEEVVGLAPGADATTKGEPNAN